MQLKSNMDRFLRLLAVFVMGGLAGWICELFYRRLAHGRWINPGFLTGPFLPLYGTGVLLLYVLCETDIGFIENPFWQKIMMILIITVAMTVIEYITGIIFTKKFHVWLWDYSKRPGNIQGVICPLFSLIWGAAGAVYYLFAHKYVALAAEKFTATSVAACLLGIILGVLAVDVGYSFNLAAKIKAWAETQRLGVRYENLKLAVRTHAEALKTKKRFVFSFGGINLKDELEHYAEMLREKSPIRKK